MDINHEASELLSNHFVSFLTRWSQVENLIRMARMISSETRSSLQQKVSPALTPAEIQEQTFVRLLQVRLKGFDIAVESAAIVFAHSVIDTFIHGLCKSSSLIGPNDWLTNIKNKKLTIGDIKRNSFENEYREKLAKFINRFERESLPVKIESLLTKLRSQIIINRINDYTFDIEKVNLFHQTRKNIVHGDSGLSEIEDIEDQIEYIKKTAEYLYALFDDKYGDSVRPDVRKALLRTFNS